jgi:hypothetical protein
MAYGENYLEWSESLIEDVTSRGAEIFVLTNAPEYYKKIKNEKLRIVEYAKPYFSFHEKKTIIRECLKHFDMAVFLDADVRIFELDNFDFLNRAENGLHVFYAFGNIGDTFLNNDISPCRAPGLRNTKYGHEGQMFLEQSGLKYKRNYHGPGYPDHFLEHYLEGKWAIKKDDGRENLFLEIWDKIADFSEKFDMDRGYIDTIGAGEGAHVSIAAYNSKIKINLRQHEITNFFTQNFISNYARKMSGEAPWNIAG